MCRYTMHVMILFHSIVVFVCLLSSSFRIDGLLILAGLPDPGDIPRHITRDRCLPLLNRWSSTDNNRIHHGQPSSQGSSDNDLSSGFLPIGHYDSGNDSGDVQLRIDDYYFDVGVIFARHRFHNAGFHSVAVSSEISQHQRG